MKKLWKNEEFSKKIEEFSRKNEKFRKRGKTTEKGRVKDNEKKLREKSKSSDLKILKIELNKNNPREPEMKKVRGKTTKVLCTSIRTMIQKRPKMFIFPKKMLDFFFYQK